MTPEQKARNAIDEKLAESGWIIQNMEEFNPAAALGVAVREFHTDSGPKSIKLLSSMWLR